MKNFKLKLVSALTIITFMLVMPIQVLATGEETNKNVQIVQQSDLSYLVYVKDKTTTFNFAISDKADATELELNYQQSVKDADNNDVALIDSASADYLYISGEENPIKLDFSKAFDVEKMEFAEKATTRIKTTASTQKEVTNVQGVEVTTIIGTLKVDGVAEEFNGDYANAEYFYSLTKLPAEKYSDLKELATKINEEYETMSMYSKIEIAQQFYNLYTELVNDTQWTTVNNQEIIPGEIQEESEEYVVFLKAVDGNNELTDIKFMTSHRENTEEAIPATFEDVTVKETTKLPITYDSMILFVVLAIVVMALIIVYARMRNIKKNQGNNK